MSAAASDARVKAARANQAAQKAGLLQTMQAVLESKRMAAQQHDFTGGEISSFQAFKAGQSNALWEYQADLDFSSYYDLPRDYVEHLFGFDIANKLYNAGRILQPSDDAAEAEQARQAEMQLHREQAEAERIKQQREDERCAQFRPAPTPASGQTFVDSAPPGLGPV